MLGAIQIWKNVIFNTRGAVLFSAQIRSDIRKIINEMVLSALAAIIPLVDLKKWNVRVVALFCSTSNEKLPMNLRIATYWSEMQFVLPKLVSVDFK